MTCKLFPNVELDIEGKRIPEPLHRFSHGDSSPEVGC